jgi:hypothetical protein
MTKSTHEAETLSALCAKQLPDAGERVRMMGNTPTTCQGSGGYRTDDHK